MRNIALNSLIFVMIISGIAVMMWADDMDIDYSDYVRITDVDYRAVVVDEPGSNGKITITERLTFDIHAASRYDLFWELWRDLPDGYVDGVKVDYNVISVRQIFNDGRAPVIFTEAPKLYWDDYDFIDTDRGLGPGKWFHSEGPYDGYQNFECVLIYVDGLYREKVVFEIVYEMNNAALRFADSSQLYLSMFSGEDVRFLKSYSGQILFPDDKMPRPGNYEAFTYGTNSHGFPFEKSAGMNPGYTTFAFELGRSQLRFKDFNQYIEFALISFGEDKHIFTQYASVNDYYNDDVLEWLRNEQRLYDAPHRIAQTAKIVILCISVLIALFTLWKAFTVDKRLKKKYNFYEPGMQMEYFRDIPDQLDPNFAAALVFCKHKYSDEVKDGYAAVLLDLVRKGYIELDRITKAGGWDPGNVGIIIRHKPGDSAIKCLQCGAAAVDGDIFCEKCGNQFSTAVPNLMPLTQTEERYLNLIIRYSKSSIITISHLQQCVSSDYEHTDSFVKSIKQTITSIGLSQGFYQTAEYKKPQLDQRANAVTLVIFGVLILLAANMLSYRTRLEFAYGSYFILGGSFIVSAIYRFITTKKYVLLKQFGEDEYAKWRGLYNFLNSETLMKEREVLDLVIWEQYLVYATAFGISEKVIKALQIRCPEASMSSSPVLRNPYYRSRGFYISSRSFRTAARNASITARTGGGGAHGSSSFGSGGRGGGGGGGGH